MPIATTLISVAEVTVLGTMTPAGSNSKASYNVFQFKRGSTVPVLTKVALYNIFNANIITPLVAAMNARYAVNTVAIRWVDDALDSPSSFANAGVGAIATDSLPVDTCVSYLYRTGLRGKNYRGSKHFTPASEADTTGDVLTGAGLARWQTLQTALAAGLTDANGNVWAPCVLSRTLSQLQVNPTTVVANNVNQVLLNLNIGTMRHRRVRTVR